MTAATTKPTDQERRVFGDLADDVAYLRNACGFFVARFKGEIRVGNDVLTDTGVREKAETERKRRNHTQQAKALTGPRAAASTPWEKAPPLIAAKAGNALPDDKRAKLHDALGSGATIGQAARSAGVSKSTAHKHAPDSTPPALMCKCGRPNSHQGRCWVRRGWAGPDEGTVPGRPPSTEERLTALETAVAELRAQLVARQ